MNKNILLISALALLLSACGDKQAQQKTDSENDTNAAVVTPASKITSINAPKKIVASFYPIAYMAEEIIGNKGSVTNMAGSVDVHDYDPSPQDLVKLNQADLVIFQGAELEPWIDSVIPELKQKGVATLEVSHDLALIKMEEHHDKHEDQDEHNDEKHTDKKHAKNEHHEKEDNHDEHHHGEFDPHTWLDPVLAQNMVDKILASIVKVDAMNKAVYQSNATALKARFAQLDQAYQSGLAQCANEKTIISHDAYGYLAHRYGFEFHSIVGLSPQDEPSAKNLAELKEKAEEGITHLLVEENNIRRFADTLARETGFKILPINPLGRGTLNPQKDFFDIMNENLNSLKEALNCSS